MEDTKEEKRAIFNKACNFNKCNKVLEESKKLMEKK
jgi:hypothetical protein